MKTCKRCNTEKSLSDYYKHKQMLDGHLNICKECKKKDSRIDYKDKIKDPSFVLSERIRCRERNKRLNYSERYKTENLSPEQIKSRLESRKSWLSRNQIKRKAYNLVWSALKSGRLKKLPCEHCGNTKTQAHHDDYSKPLSVRWLCSEHHGMEHRKCVGNNF